MLWTEFSVFYVKVGFPKELTLYVGWISELSE
jgi:hypothetical protein